MIIFPNTVPSRFVYEFLPDLLYNTIIVDIDKNKLDAMDSYLNELGIEQSTLDIIKFALDNLEIKDVNGVYIIEVSNILKVKQYTLSQLIRLIDYGNTEVKGIGAIRESVDYVMKHRGTILEDYLNG